jgi:hypothetical protein
MAAQLRARAAMPPAYAGGVNSCYINAALGACAACRRSVGLPEKRGHVGFHSKETAIAIFNKAACKALRPLHNGRQGDALEAFQLMADEEIQAATKGEILTTMDCKQSPKEHVACQKRDAINDIQLQLPESHSEHTSVRALLSAYFHADDKVDDVYCNTCKTKGHARLHREITVDMPRILVLHVQRSRVVGRRMHTSVHVPLKFKIENATRGGKQRLAIKQCDLVCVILHVGDTAERGHYTLLTKKEGVWWCVDDAKVTEVPNVVLFLRSVGSDVLTMFYTVVNDVSKADP